MLCWPSWFGITVLLNGFLLAHQILFQRTEKKRKTLQLLQDKNLMVIRHSHILCVHANPFLLPSPCCLSWRKLSAISHKDICGWRTQLTLCLLITSLDLSEGRGSEVEGLTGSDSLANQAQIPLHEDKPLAKQTF